MGCLNIKNPQVKEWIDNVGFDETYRQYLNHNYALPTYKSYLQKGAYAGMNREQIKVQLSKLLNPNLYKFDVVKKILDSAPDAQAAFWKDTFYFARKANALQVGEEAFHAIFQTLTDPADQKILYSVAENLLQERAKKAGKTVQQLVKNYSASTKLEGDALYKYALEEELAKTFVNWYTYDNQLVTEQSIKDLWKNKDVSLGEKLYNTLIELFDKLVELIRGYNRNKELLETYFSNIKSGQYKLNNPRFATDSVFPSLSTIKLVSADTNEQYVMDVIEQNLMYSKIVALGHQIKDKVSGMSDTEILQIAVDAYIQHLESSPNVKNKADIIGNLKKFKGRDREARSILLKDVLKRFVTKEQEDDSEFDETDIEQGGEAKERQWDEEANTIDHYTSLSKKIKAIMETIHVNSRLDEEVVHTFKNAAGQDATLKLRLNRMADPTKIYAAVVRATSNSGTEIEKLRNLILFTRDSNLNTDTKAFVDYTFTRLFGDRVEEAKDAILDKNTQSIVDMVVDANYYQSLIKAFDLWTRPARVYNFALEDGFFDSFNPNMTNVKSIQLDKWEKNWRALKGNFMSPEAQTERLSYFDDIIFKQGADSFQFNEGDDTSTLAVDSEATLDKVYKSLGIDLSKNYLKYIISKTYIDKLGIGEMLPQEFRDVYESFLLEESDMDEDLFGLMQALKGDESFDIEEVYLREQDNDGTRIDKGFVTRFEKVAMGNAIFDESVLATSYLDADNKRRYAHQVKTFALRFLGSTVKDNKKIDLHQEELKALSAEAGNFFIDNVYLNFIKSLSPKEKGRLKFSSYGGAQLKNFKTNEKIKETVNEIVADDFVFLEANALINSVANHRKDETSTGGNGLTKEANDKLAVSYFTGFVEASNTLTMFTSKWFNDTADKKMVETKTGIREGDKVNKSHIIAGQMAVDMAYRLLEQQMNRVKGVNDKIRPLLRTSSFDKDGKLELVLDAVSLKKDLLFNGDIIEKYHTGTVYYKLDENSDIQLDVDRNIANYKNLPRAFTITNSLAGYYSNPATVYNHFLNNTTREDIDDSIQESLNNLLDEAYDLMLGEGIGKSILSKEYMTNMLDTKAKKLGFLQHDENTYTQDGTFKTNVGKFFFNSMFNREHFHRAAFGDSAVISKNDITDQSKRFKGFEGQMLSVKSLITNTFKGVMKPLLEVRFVTELSSANDSKDKNTSGLWDGVNPKVGKKVDQDDAQSRTTVQFTRSYLHGLDRLSNDLVRVIDKVQNGIEFTEEEQKEIKDKKLHLGVEKSKGFGPQQDIKHGVQILRKLETSLKHDITDNISLEELNEHINITPTLGGKSYFITPREGATRELTVEFDTKKYQFYEEAFFANDIKIYEWTAQSDFLHTRRKMMEGWRTINGEQVYSASKEFDLLSPTEAHKRRIVNVVQDINDLNTSTNSIQSLDAEYYGRQVENPAKDAVSDPSQQIEIITSSLNDKVEFISNGKKQTVDKDVIISHVQRLLAKRDSTNVLGAIEELRDEHGNTNLGLFYNTIIETLKETGADRQLVEAFSVIGDQPVVNGNIPFIKNKLEQYLFAHFSKGVLVQKRDGDAKAMVSPRGQVILKKIVTKKIKGKNVKVWESIPKNTAGYNELFAKASANRFEELGLSYNGQSTATHRNTLQAKLNTLSDGDYFTDELRFNVPVERNGVIQYFTETIIPKYHHKQNYLQDAFRYMTGVRIPSQDKSTSANLMIVDMVDISGANTIITAKEIQHLSGADYDIDKIFTTYAEGYWVGNTFKLYERNYADYRKYIFGKNKALKKIYSEITEKSEELKVAEQEYTDYKNTLGEISDFVIEELESLHTDRAEIENTLKGLDDAFSKLVNERNEILEKVKKDRKTWIYSLDAANDAIDDFIEQEKSQKEEIIQAKKDLKNIYEDINRYAALSKANDKEKFFLLDNIRNIKENLKKEALGKLRLPRTEMEFITKFPNTSKKKDTFNGGEYNAIVNNELLEASFSLLTSNEKAYSNIISVDPLRNIDKNSKTGGLNILARARELTLKADPTSNDANFEYTPEIPYHSILFDSYYKKRIKASQIGIGAAVNANLTFLLLSRLGVELDPGAGFAIPYKRNKKTNPILFNKFSEIMPSYPNQGKDKFVSDWISTVISVTTDEAKEGILAKYNLQGEVLTAFVTGLQLGMHPELLISLLNNKNIQALNKNADRNPLSPNRQFGLLELIGEQLRGYKQDEEDPTLTDEVLIEGLLSYTTSNDYAVLEAVANLLVIAQQNSDTVKVMRVKRGLNPTYAELTDTIVSVKKLGLGGAEYYEDHFPFVDPSEVHRPYDLVPYMKHGNIKQFTNYIDNILPDIYRMSGTILLEGTKTYKKIENYAKTQLVVRGGKENKKRFEQELLAAFLGHTIAKINSVPLMEEGQKPDPRVNRQRPYTISPKKEDVVGDNTLAKELDLLIADYPELRDKNKSNPIFDRLLSKTASTKLEKNKKVGSAIDSISLNVFSKVSPELQSELMDNFAELTQVIDNPTEKDIRVKNFLMRLLDYYAGKDALGFSPVSVSKMFAPTYFQDISNYYDYILKEQPLDNKITSEVLNRFVTDIRNIDFLPPIKKSEKRGIDIKYAAGGSLITVSTKKPTAPLTYYRQTTEKGTKINSVLRHIGSASPHEHFYLEYPSLGHKDYKSSVAEGRFTYQNVRRALIIKNLKEFVVPTTLPSNMRDLIDKHITRLEEVSDVEVSTAETTKQFINTFTTTEQLYGYFAGLTKKQQIASKFLVAEKRRATVAGILYNDKITVDDSNFNTKRKIYTGLITKLEPKEVFVFGANIKGWHGAGAAGVAMGQQRRLAEVKALPDGTKGAWAVIGEHSQISEGLEGKSYGLVTVDEFPGRKGKKNRLKASDLRKNISKLYQDAVANPTLTFKIAYDAKERNTPSLNGFTPLELAVLFASHNPIPKNIQFEAGFSRLINELTGLEKTEQHAPEATQEVAPEDVYNEEEEAYYNSLEEDEFDELDLDRFTTVKELAKEFDTYTMEQQSLYRDQFTARKEEIEAGKVDERGQAEDERMEELRKLLEDEDNDAAQSNTGGQYPRINQTEIAAKQSLQEEIISQGQRILSANFEPSSSEHKSNLSQEQSVLFDRQFSSIALQQSVGNKTLKEIWDSSEATSLQRKQSLLLAIRQRLFDQNSFNGKLFDKVNRELGTTFNVGLDGIFGMAANSNSIILNINTFYNNLLQNKDMGDIDKYLDLIVAEELIHNVTFNLTNEEDRLAILGEQTSNNKGFLEALKKKYTGLNSMDAVYYEYIRMGVQKHFFNGNTSELVQFENAPILEKRVLVRAWEFLKSVFTLQKTKEVIQRHIDYINTALNENNGDIIGGGTEVSRRFLSATRGRDFDRLQSNRKLDVERKTTREFYPQLAAMQKGIVSEINSGQKIDTSSMASGDSIVQLIRQKLSDTNTLNGRLFKKLGTSLDSIKLLNTGHFIYVKGQTLYINPDALLEHLKDSNNQKYLDTLLFEELIHLLTNQLYSAKEMKGFAQEQIEKDNTFKNKVSQMYATGSNEEAYYEYVRIMVQDQILGTTTLGDRYSFVEKGLEILASIMKVIKTIIQTDNTKRLIQQHVDYINTALDENTVYLPTNIEDLNDFANFDKPCI